MNVAVILSTFNGETYLSEQIDSVLEQSYQNITLYIRDDGSDDETKQILAAYQDQDPRVVISYGENVGCIRSFLFAVQQINADIYLFCDQDDIWVKDKVSWAVDYFKQNNRSIPLLYHSDLYVVDQQMRMISDSFLKYQGLSAIDTMKRKTIFIQNFVVGCTTAVNKALITRLFINGMPDDIAMHDWWMALIARTQGDIHFDPRKTLYYRQHDKNVLGANKRTYRTYLNALLSGDGLKRFMKFRALTSKQARSFLNTYHEYLHDEDKENFVNIYRINDIGGLGPVLKCFWSGIYLQGSFRNIALLYAAIVDGLARLGKR